MICPHCGARLEDGTPICPACGTDLGVTNKIARVTGTWCPSCGALIPDGADACPKCGMPSPNAKAARPVRDIKLPKVSDADKTSEFSAIQPTPPDEQPVVDAKSALPPVRKMNEDVTLGYDRMARVRVMAIAAVAALLVIGGITAFIFHPFGTGDDTPVSDGSDIAPAGSPGQIEALSGQDVRSTTPSTPVDEASSASFDVIYDAYVELGDLAVRVDEQEAYFLENYLLEDWDVREQGRDAVAALDAEIAALIDSVEQIGASSDYYEESVNVAQLGRWLRYRCEALSNAWYIDLGYLAPAQVQYSIDEAYYADKDEDGVSINKKYFDVCYEDWEPKEH